MDKEMIVINGWMTDVAIAGNDNISAESILFKSHITHPEVYSVLYGNVAPDFTNEIITLNRDYVVDSVKSFRGKHVLDLNGHNVSNENDLYDLNKSVWSLFEVNQGSNVTIKGNGKVVAKENDCYVVDVKNGGNLVIEDGEFIGNISAVYVYEGTAVINGGTFKIQQLDPKAPQNGYGYLLNCFDANYKNGKAKLEVRGGKFYGFNPAANIEGTGTSYVADGYESVELEPGVWTVQKKA